MAFRTSRARSDVNRGPFVVRSGRRTGGSAGALQWIIILAVGLAVGLYVVLLPYIPPEVAPVSLFVLLALFALLLFGNLERVILAVLIFDIPLAIDMHVGYREELELLGAFAGLNISVMTLALAALYAMWLSKALVGRSGPTRPALNASIPLILYLAFAGISVVAARDVVLSGYELFLLFQVLILFIYLVATVRTREQVRFLVTTVVLALVVESLIIIALAFVGESIWLGRVFMRVDHDPGMGLRSMRVGGTVGSPNDAAMYLDMALTIALGLLLASVGRWTKILTLLAFGLGSAALVLTFSRGGWIGFFIAVSVVLLVAWRRGWLSASIPILAGFAVLVVGVALQGPLIEALFAEDAGSAYSRVALIQIALRVVQDNPLLGIGLNNFSLVLKEYVTPEFSRNWIYTVHNKFLLVLAETGIGGLAAFLFFMFSTLYRGWQAIQSGDRLLGPIALGLTASVLALTINMLVQVVNSQPQIQMLGLAAGLLVAVGLLIREEGGEQARSRHSRSPTVRREVWTEAP